MKQSGFVAITSPRYETPIDLSMFAKLRFRVRRRGALFISNIKTDSRVDDDLFQCFMLAGDSVGHSNRDTRVPTAHIVSPYAENVTVASKRDCSRLGSISSVDQPRIAAGDEPFEIIDLPFADYAHTWRGFLEDDENRLDPFDILSFGILMAERRTGPFELDLHSIEAVTQDQSEQELKRFVQ